MNHLLPALRVQGLTFGYPHCAVFENFEARLLPGPNLVRGDESTGKTTLLRLLAGDLVPRAGSLVLELPGRPPASAPFRALVAWFDPRSDALEGQTPRDWYGCLPQSRAAWDAAALQAHVQGFMLEPHLDKPLGALSTGTRRKVLMAGALACGAPLTLIDEPVAGLDKASIAYLAHVLTGVAMRADRVVVVAHHEALAGVPWAQVVELPGA